MLKAVCKREFIRCQIRFGSHLQRIPVQCQGDRHRIRGIVVHDHVMRFLIVFFRILFRNHFHHNVGMRGGIHIVSIAVHAHIRQTIGDGAEGECAVRSHVNHSFRGHRRLGGKGNDLHLELAVGHRQFHISMGIHEMLFAADDGLRFDEAVHNGIAVPVVLHLGYIVIHIVLGDGVLNGFSVLAVLGKVIEGVFPNVGVLRAEAIGVDRAGQDLFPVGKQVDHHVGRPQVEMLCIPLPLLAHLHLHALRVHKHSFVRRFFPIGNGLIDFERTIAVVADGHGQGVNGAVRGELAFLAFLHGVVRHGFHQRIAIGLSDVGHTEFDGLESDLPIGVVGGTAHGDAKIVAQLEIELAILQLHAIGRHHFLPGLDGPASLGFVSVFKGRFAELVAHDGPGVARFGGQREAAGKIGFLERIGRAVGQILDFQRLIRFQLHRAMPVVISHQRVNGLLVQHDGELHSRQGASILINQRYSHGKFRAILCFGGPCHCFGDGQRAVLPGIGKDIAVFLILRIVVRDGRRQGAFAFCILHVNSDPNDSSIIIHGGICAGHLADIVYVLSFLRIADRAEFGQALVVFRVFRGGIADGFAGVQRGILDFQRLGVRLGFVAFGVPILGLVQLKGVGAVGRDFSLHLLFHLEPGAALDRVGVGEGGAAGCGGYDLSAVSGLVRQRPAVGHIQFFHLIFQIGGNRDLDLFVALERYRYCAVFDGQGNIFRAFICRLHSRQLCQRITEQLELGVLVHLVGEGHFEGEFLILGRIGRSDDGFGNGQVAGSRVILIHAVALVPL